MDRKRNVHQYWMMLIVAGVAFLAYGGRLFSLTIGIDTEAVINVPDSPGGWFLIERGGSITKGDF